MIDSPLSLNTLPVWMGQSSITMVGKSIFSNVGETKRLRPSTKSPNNLAINKYTTLQYGDSVAKHLNRLEALSIEPDLCPEGAPPPARASLDFARAILIRLHEIFSINPDEVVATADGGVAICFVNGNNYSDIEFLNGGSILCVTTNRRDRPTVWEVGSGLSEIDGACAKIKKFINGNT